MTDFIKPILDALKLNPIYFAATAGICGLLLFGSPDFVKQLGLSQLTENYRPVIGVLFLVSIALCLIAAFNWIMLRINRNRRKRKIETKIVERLHTLTEDEKQILRYYIAKQTRANTLCTDDGIVQGLVSARIIYLSASMGNVLEGFAHNITPFAWDYLHENPALLNGSTNTYRTDKNESYPW